MIKAVLFDFDCTLYSRDLAYVGLLPAFKKHFEGRLTPGMSDEALLQALWRCDRVGSYTNGGGWPRILDRQIEAGLWTAPPTAEEMLERGGRPCRAAFPGASLRSGAIPPTGSYWRRAWECCCSRWD